MWTLDTETKGIDGNPLMYPPEMVGCALKHDDEPSQYLQMGDELAVILGSVWESGEPLLFHNCMFDLCVINKWLALPFPHWERVHDTRIMIYLDNPHAPNLSLKPSGERLLGRKPEEQDELREWVLANVKNATKKNWGAHMWKAPFETLARYAKQDVDLTKAIYDKLHLHTQMEAYDRERGLLYPLSEATMTGIRVDRNELEKELGLAMQSQITCEDKIRTLLKAPGLNPHSGKELAEALDKEGKVSGWETTPTGKKSTAKKNLMQHINDPELLQYLLYTSAMQTCIGTFMEPWLEKSTMTGRLHPNWNQVRTHDGRSKGTRTGRLSSDDPNFQNVPTPFDFVIPDGLLPMPNMRRFLLPEEGHVWVSRDFRSQEMRLLAHFERGILAEAFRKDPELDPHMLVKELILQKTGRDLPRKTVKNIGFGVMYGMGMGALAQGIGCDAAEARAMYEAYMQALPGVRKLQEGTKSRGRMGGAIRTWGGRFYKAEEAREINGNWRSFEYKLLNYLIQGSAADQTKECMLQFFRTRPENVKFLATVHDEINISVPEGQTCDLLRECMELDMFEVPMRTTLEVGYNWGELV